MNPHNVGSPANLLHQCGSALSRCCGGSILCDFLAAHKFSFSYNQILLSFLTISFTAALVALTPSSRKFLPEKRTGAHRLNAVLYGSLGAVAKPGNLGITQTLQCVEQEPAALRLSTERKGGSVQILVYFDCDLHGQGLSVYVDGDFHLPFLHSDFL